MNLRLWSGIAGIAFVVLNIAVVAMYASGGAMPRADDAVALAA